MNRQPTVNITRPEFKANPYPFYARLRAEAPVYPTKLPDKQTAWLITRYDDVAMTLKDDQRFVKNRQRAMSTEQLAKIPWTPPMFRALERNILDLDGEEHARLRGLIHKAFTPKLVEQLRGRVEAVSNELLDAAERRGDVDLIRDFALPLPLSIISEMLGVAPADRDKFRRWAKSLIALSASPNALLVGFPQMLAIMRYLRRTVKLHRSQPDDGLISALVEVQESGDQLTEDEILAMIFVLLIAGHETTVNLIGSGTLALLENPDQLALLRQQPDLLKPAIEELLRYISPVEQATERYAHEDITLDNVTIPKGGLVLAVIASANRDATQFDHPDTLDITRTDIKHLAFGLGIHYCVGAPLARMEGQIAIQTLIQRRPTLRLKTPSEKLRWRAGLTVRGLEALPVAL